MDSANESSQREDQNGGPAQIDLYWRPGCGFCSMLRRKLDKLGLERVEHDIWEEPEKADTVRRHANGNETVPTVVVGDVGFVNPSADELFAHLAAHAPHLLPAEQPNGSADGGLGGVIGRVFGS